MKIHVLGIEKEGNIDWIEYNSIVFYYVPDFPGVRFTSICVTKFKIQDEELHYVRQEDGKKRILNLNNVRCVSIHPNKT